MPTASTMAAAVALPPNPVWRSYVGGSILRDFRGQPDTSDNHFPEDWLASTVHARNGIHAQHDAEGLSRLADADGGQLLNDLLKAQPEFWFGTDAANGASTGTTGVLWKLLDASVRLQIQAHPDAGFARRHLNSRAGKTECWYILGTRDDAYVHLGFQRPPARDAWAHMIREQRIDEMLACFDKISVLPGDCFVVPAGTPHAIGAGIFMLELQEPTDWVVRCEFANAGLVLSSEACFMGLDLEKCLDVFNYQAHSVQEVRKKFQQRPNVIAQTDNATEEELINPAYHQFFRLQRLRGSGRLSWPGNELMLLIVLKGSGSLNSGTDARSVDAGQTWLLPGCVPKWEWLGCEEHWEILLAKLPIVRKESTAQPPETSRVVN